MSWGPDLEGIVSKPGSQTIAAVESVTRYQILFLWPFATIIYLMYKKNKNRHKYTMNICATTMFISRYLQEFGEKRA